MTGRESLWGSSPNGSVNGTSLDRRIIGPVKLLLRDVRGLAEYP